MIRRSCHCLPIYISFRYCHLNLLHYLQERILSPSYYNRRSQWRGKGIFLVGVGNHHKYGERHRDSNFQQRVTFLWVETIMGMTTTLGIVAILQIVAVLKQQLLLRIMGILSIIYTKGFEYLTDKLISIQGIVTVPTLISTFLFLGRVTVLWLLIILEMTTVHERITVLLTQGW